VQEIWGRAYYARYQRLPQVQEKADLHAAKKAGKKPNPAKQLFTQLSKKLDKLEKTLKKASHKSKKRRMDNSDSDSE
jgi:flagellar hook-basal body complex protein FliE